MPKTSDKLTKYGPAKSGEYSNAPYDEEECGLCVDHQDYPTHDECENERKYAVAEHTDALEEGTAKKSSQSSCQILQSLHKILQLDIDRVHTNNCIHAG